MTLLKGVYHLMCYVLIPSSHQVILYIVECKALKTASIMAQNYCVIEQSIVLLSNM